MYRTILGDTFFTILTNERDDVIEYLKLEQMEDGIRDISKLPDDKGYKDAHIIQRVAL